jgi:hypothetical protein
VESLAMTNTAIPPEQHFYLHEGGVLENLEDLFTELQTMEAHVYDHHVSETNNDFSNWVREVMGDRFLAKNIELCRDKDQLLKLLFMNLFR